MGLIPLLVSERHEQLARSEDPDLLNLTVLPAAGRFFPLHMLPREELVP